MTTIEKLNDTKEQLQTVQLKIKGLTALTFLETLWTEAEFHSSTMLRYEADYNELGRNKLFGHLRIDYFAEEKKLLNQIKKMAAHFKDMDDSREFPEWKKEAYKAAKIYQEYFNSTQPKY